MAGYTTNREPRREPRSEQPMIFGLRPIIEAIEEGKTLDKVFIKSGLEGELSRELMGKLKAHQVPFQYVPLAKLNRFTRKNHQGAVALISPVEFANLEEIVNGIYETGEMPLIVALDGVTDVRNFGAIVRSAECLGAHAVAVPARGTASIGPDAVKTSAGALMRLPICKVANLKSSLQNLQQSGLKVVCFSEKAKPSLHEIVLKDPLVLVMGAEDTGVSKEILALADEQVRIPMSGKTGSLNVSVSAGIALYEVTRQRAQYED